LPLFTAGVTINIYGLHRAVHGEVELRHDSTAASHKINQVLSATPGIQAP
jgi:hypothetical protein